MSLRKAVKDVFDRIVRKAKAADLAEAREKELLILIEQLKDVATHYEFDAECRKTLLDKAKAEKEVMIASLDSAKRCTLGLIAELRTMHRNYCTRGTHTAVIGRYALETVLTKYETITKTESTE